ncbi:protein lifeguard 1-like isoform X4 [Hermetia illucens]|nr:protein lifeguard 1-like isoform X4 [Hermetia illucens]
MPQQGYGGTYNDPEQGMDDGDVKGFGFSEESIRKAFIRKVYSILMIQLLITFGVVCLFSYHMPTQLWVRQHSYLVWVALAVMIVTLIAMACCGEVRRKSPTNIIFLILFTMAESFLLGVTAATYRAQEVSIAIGITAAVCLGLTLFAFQTKWDFTVMGGVLFVALIVFMIFGIVAIFLPGKTMTLVYSSLGALLFSFYLIYDTQLIIGGKHKYSISPEEYIFAALNLYLDVINIFIYILSILGASRN